MTEKHEAITHTARITGTIPLDVLSVVSQSVKLAQAVEKLACEKGIYGREQVEEYRTEWARQTLLSVVTRLMQDGYCADCVLAMAQESIEISTAAIGNVAPNCGAGKDGKAGKKDAGLQ